VTEAAVERGVTAAPFHLALSIGILLLMPLALHTAGLGEAVATPRSACVARLNTIRTLPVLLSITAQVQTMIGSTQEFSSRILLAGTGARRFGHCSYSI
jgi:hypothetical protein